MSVISKSFSALSKLITVAVLLAAFLGGMAGVVYMSLSGEELKVPELVGKDFVQSEKELEALGLKIKRRADRVSTEPINTVLEQLPKAGETVKTGQMILVVVSKAGLAGEEAPPSSLQKDLEADDAEKIEEMISDKPKKKTNSNTSKKKAETTRDVIANESSSNTATGEPAKQGESKPADADKKDSGDKEKDPPKGTAPKSQNTPTSKPDNEPRLEP